MDLIQTPIPVERHDLSNGRWYTPIDSYWEEHFGEDTPKIYKRSSTTFDGVIDKGMGFARWLGNSSSYDAAMDYANERATKGTIVHDYCERLLLGTEIDLSHPWHDKETDRLIPIDDEIIKYVMSFVQFTQGIEYTTEALEICMFDLAADNEGNQLHPWAGTADWVTRIVNKKGEEERWLIDFKTGNAYNTHQLQLTSYKMLWDALFPELPIDGIGCLYLKSGWRKEPNFTFKKYNPVPELWNKVVELSDWANNYPVPRFRQELPTVFQIEKAQDNTKESK